MPGMVSILAPDSIFSSQKSEQCYLVRKHAQLDSHASAHDGETGREISSPSSKKGSFQSEQQDRKERNGKFKDCGDSVFERHNMLT